ncbi:site-specific DNA-methyltransferase [Flavobacteriaceae bacterium]|nr:site-specific DNA-methyltransferase [Flavobacteriaceae bacterium]
MSIEKINQGDQLSQSADLVNDNIDKLKMLFPEIVTEGRIDFKVLQQVLGEELEEEEEYYRFTWAGKSQARREAHKPSTGTLRPAKEESLDWDTTENMYIEGDNLEVLKLLQKSYAGKIKMIYIDPPYNTGKDFVYKDNYKDNLKNYQEVTRQIDSEGNKTSTNSDSDGRYHSNWLNMMYPRLRLARNLLKDDGVIFMSIDDNEVDNLKKLGNDVFGESNFVEQFIWEKIHTIKANAKDFSTRHEYILLFSKNKKNIKVKYLQRTEKQLKEYKNPDNDPRGVYSRGNLLSPKYTESNYYEIKLDNGKSYKPKQGSSWRFKKEKILELIKDNRIIFEPNMLRQKRFLSESNPGVTPETILFHSMVGHTQKGTEELKEIFKNKIFDYPKPSSLIHWLGNRFLENDDIILDFFSGSGTTAHATMKLNLEDNCNSKYIMVQLPEKIDLKSEAFRVGYSTISDIGKERIRRVVQKIKEEHPKKSKDMDLGFKVFKLDSSNIKSWDGNPDNLNESLFDAVGNIKTDRTEEDVLYEILLKYGLDLTLPIEEKTIEGKKVFNVGLGSLFICLADGITSKVAEGIGQWKENCSPEICRVIFKDNGFTDVEKTNSVQTLKRYGINEIRSI